MRKKASSPDSPNVTGRLMTSTSKLHRT
jgi:hypothetical protein